MNRIIISTYNKIRNVYRIPPQITGLSLRSYCENNVVTEEQIKSVLQKKFPQSQAIRVEDVSGGCGAMFNIYIESSDFKGLSIPKQHRSVYDTLREQIKNIHGLHLETKVPS